jgi:hypothetical protein
MECFEWVRIQGKDVNRSARSSKGIAVDIKAVVNVIRRFGPAVTAE